MAGMAADPATGTEGTTLLARASESLRAQGLPGIPIGLVASVPAFLAPSIAWHRGRVGLGLALLVVQYALVMAGRRYGYRRRVAAAVPAAPSASFETAGQTRRRLYRRYRWANVASLLTLSIFGSILRFPLGAGLVGFSAAFLTRAMWLRWWERRHGVVLWGTAATGGLRLRDPAHQLYLTPGAPGSLGSPGSASTS